MAEGEIYRVTVTHNVVSYIGRVAEAEAAGVEVPDSKLEVSTQLARNNQMNGCLDGDYHFDHIEVAKHFAVLALDFAKRQIERSIEEIEGTTFAQDAVWHNPHHGLAAGRRH